MSTYRDFDSPPDVTLLLRAHSEQRWLSHEVIPVLRQIETGDHLPEEQLPAALAYLEVIWSEAAALARAADAARTRLDELAPAAPDSPAPESAAPESLAPESPASSQPRHPLDSHHTLPAKARRYHTLVGALREVVGQRVVALIAAPSDHAGTDYAGVASSACSR